MTIYAEVVLLGNFFIDLFIFVLTVKLCGGPVSRTRIITASVVGGVASAIVPLLPQYIFPIKIICVVLFPALIKRHDYFRSYLVTLSLFLVITFILGGIAYAIKCSVSNRIYIILSYGPVPVLFSMSGLCFLILITELKKRLLSERRRNDLRRKVTIYDGKNKYTGVAYYDSGNRVYANNDEPVTVVGGRVYNIFHGEEDEVLVSTVSGITALKTKEVKIKIYSDSGDNIIYKTKIALAPSIGGGEEIILHGDMEV